MMYPEIEMYSIAVHNELGGVELFRRVQAHSAGGAVTQLSEQFSMGNADYGMTTAPAPTTLPAPAFPGRVFVVLSLETDTDRIELGEVRAVQVYADPPPIVAAFQQVFEVEVGGKPKAYRTN